MKYIFLIILSYQSIPLNVLRQLCFLPLLLLPLCNHLLFKISVKQIFDLVRWCLVDHALTLLLECELVVLDGLLQLGVCCLLQDGFVCPVLLPPFELMHHLHLVLSLCLQIPLVLS